MIFATTLLTPKEVAKEIWGRDDPSIMRRVYRWLRNGNFDAAAQVAGTPIIRDGNRFHIPMAVIKTMRGEK